MDEEEFMQYAQWERYNYDLARTLSLLDKRIAELESVDTENVELFSCLENDVSASLDIPVAGDYIVGYALKNAVPSTVTVNFYVSGTLVYTTTTTIAALNEGDTLNFLVGAFTFTTSDILTIEISSPNVISDMDVCINLTYTP